MILNRNMHDARDRVLSAVSHLETELKAINSLYNKMQRDLELRTIGYVSRHDGSTTPDNSITDEGVDDITALLTLMKTTQLVLQSITIRIDALIYMQELLMLLGRAMSILNSIRSDIKRIEQSMQSMMQSIGTSFIESKVELGYNERMELPRIDEHMHNHAP
ncbi:MAG: hypothetical protein RMJ59_01670 [Candidatus Nitrosocaldus sp.]|nr:hypothetical protein [Candidatus Nitrosocaldus sp.]MCS7140699.1 hypothetical protein [Candidatus Nitrosocaldus sp.]MDW7999486.1 hypothetical protein [Candidatus Nitrosocaldus sp.]MDW8275074.1 hypothetical protein [Candidatus Nitrosocaldus sp.]